jgi:hypothetical protein
MTQKSLLACVLMTSLATAHGEMVRVTNSPSAWRLENYVGSEVVLWFTSSPCANGQVTFNAPASQADVNRLWATVSIAKTTGRKMFLYYDNASAPARCPIVSFGLEEE